MATAASRGERRPTARPAKMTAGTKVSVAMKPSQTTADWRGLVRLDRDATTSAEESAVVYGSTNRSAATAAGPIGSSTAASTRERVPQVRARGDRGLDRGGHAVTATRARLPLTSATPTSDDQDEAGCQRDDPGWDVVDEEGRHGGEHRSEPKHDQRQQRTALAAPGGDDARQAGQRRGRSRSARSTSAGVLRRRRGGPSTSRKETTPSRTSPVRWERVMVTSEGCARRVRADGSTLGQNGSGVRGRRSRDRREIQRGAGIAIPAVRESRGAH